MKTLSWNCQGLGNPQKIWELNCLVKIKLPSIIFLMETKSSEVQMEKIKSRIGAKYCFLVNLVGSKGGLAMLWFKETDLEIINFTDFHIHNKIVEKFLGVISFLTIFYGVPEMSNRNGSWNLLGRVNPGQNVRWCVLGDFNEIIS